MRTASRCLTVAGLLLSLLPAPTSADVPFDEAITAIARHRSALLEALARMDRHPEIYARSESTRPRLVTPEGRADAIANWAAFADRLFALEQAGADLGTPGLFSDRWFALQRASFLARYRASMEFIERIERDPGLARLLDEASPQHGLPERSYARLKFHWLNVARATEYSAVEFLHHTRRSKPPKTLAQGAREDAKAVLRFGAGAGPRMTAANAVAVIEDSLMIAWMPAQESVARWMGDVRVRRQGEALISNAQLAALPAELEPGDILLQRREWYLTNAGIPGFWTHAALYIGTPEERREFFAEPREEAWLRHESEGDIELWLARSAPDATTRSAGTDSGHPVRVIEAIADGVTFTSLEHSAGADSLAVLRPRLSKRERAIAISRALAYAGRPYDYDFDFATDGSLVCSELVYKSYQPSADLRGIDVPLSSVAGRMMLTPNEMARYFAATRDAPDRSFDFVLMLDGSEATGTAARVSEDVFATSWERPKWHILTSRLAAGEP